MRWSFIRPALWLRANLGFEVVSSAPLEGQADHERMELILLDTTGDFVRVLSVEDMIADRIGQHASGSAPDMLDQARKLFILFPKLDRDYLEQRIRYETAGEHGVEDLL